MIPRARRAWADGGRDVSREQEQDARAVEESPDPDAMTEASKGHLIKAAGHIFQRSVAQSLRSVIEEAGIIRRLARQGASQKAVAQHLPPEKIAAE
mgnify:CR=1 FL=1